MTINQVKPWLAYGLRPENAVVDTVVMHATGGSSVDGAIETLRERNLSYHYLIAKDGGVFKCCPSTGRASHAGNSYGPHEQDHGVSHKQDSKSLFKTGCSVNGYSIGISFCNMDDGVDPYTDAQWESAVELVRLLKAGFPLAWVTTHKIVSPGRKVDPNGFDIDKFGEMVGLRVWRYGAR